jgi:tetrahydromethanopterin S-methyltransferase subunit G
MKQDFNESLNNESLNNESLNNLYRIVLKRVETFYQINKRLDAIEKRLEAIEKK